MSFHLRTIGKYVAKVFLAVVFVVNVVFKMLLPTPTQSWLFADEFVFPKTIDPVLEHTAPFPITILSVPTLEALPIPMPFPIAIASLPMRLGLAIASLPIRLGLRML